MSGERKMTDAEIVAACETLTASQESAMLAGCTYAHGAKRTIVSLVARGFCDGDPFVLEHNVVNGERGAFERVTWSALKNADGWAAELQIGRNRSERERARCDRARAIYQDAIDRERARWGR